jgi:lipoprotein-releasing system ATP-binding protein
MPNSILRLQNVSKTYGEGAVTACEVLHELNIDIRGGEMTALIGPSGSGKSTLLNLIGLLDRPTRGAIFLDGVNTGELGERELTVLRGRKIGFVFQFHHLLPAFSALENVLLPAQSLDRWQTPEMRQRAEMLLSEVGLANEIHRKAFELSGGQQQRVAVARALMNHPPLLLADEPTGNLDTGTADSVFALFRRLLLEEGSAALVVTHDPRLAKRTDRVLSLVDGRIVSDRRNSDKKQVTQST